MIGKSEVITKKQDVIGKLEIKNKDGQVHFIPSLPSNLATLQGTRAPEVPSSTAQGGH